MPAEQPTPKIIEVPTEAMIVEAFQKVATPIVQRLLKTIPGAYRYKIRLATQQEPREYELQVLLELHPQKIATHPQFWGQKMLEELLEKLPPQSVLRNVPFSL